MPYLKYPQLSSNGLHSQGDNTSSAHPQGGVVQDKVALTSDRKATTQPASVPHRIRPRPSNSKNARSQSTNTRKRNKVPFTLHVDPILKAAVKRQAETDKVSASSCGSDLLEAMIRQTIHQQQAATLESTLESIIDRKIGKRDARLAHLLVRILFAVEQTRIIDTNALSRMPGVTPALLNAILDKSHQDARAKITYRNPQLEDIYQELQAMFSETEERGEEKKPPPK
jgi:hypothetical protein